MSTSGIRRLGISMAALAASYFANGQRHVQPIPQEALKNRWDSRTNRFQQRVDVYYLSSAYKRASKSKKYPFNSDRQTERHQRNYGCTEDGTIFAVGSKHRNELAQQSIFAEEKQA